MDRGEQDRLLNALLSCARRLLEEHGEFYPFAAVITSEGAARLVAGQIGAERPKPSQVIEVLSEGLRREIARGGHRAAGICVSVRIRTRKRDEETDAIQSRIEDAEGNAVNVYLPYQVDSSGRVSYGEPISEKGTPTLFK